MKFPRVIQSHVPLALSLALALAGWPAASSAASDSASPPIQADSNAAPQRPLIAPSPSFSQDASNYLRSLTVSNTPALPPAASLPDSATNAPSALTPTNSVPSASMEALDDKFILGIGDRISFRIEEDLDDPREPLEPKPLVVTDSGEIEIPYLGRIHAENTTCKQLAREIKTLLEKDYYKQATVILSIDLKSKTRGKIYIVGPVRIPGPQDIPSDEVLTLSKAIMHAGGFGDFADRRNVKITRKSAHGEGDKQTIIRDVGEIFDKGKVENDIELQPGDIILVPERTIRF